MGGKNHFLFKDEWFELFVHEDCNKFHIFWRMWSHIWWRLTASVRQQEPDLNTFPDLNYCLFHLHFWSFWFCWILLNWSCNLSLCICLCASSEMTGPCPQGWSWLTGASRFRVLWSFSSQVSTSVSPPTITWRQRCRSTSQSILMLLGLVGECVSASLVVDSQHRMWC